MNYLHVGHSISGQQALCFSDLPGNSRPQLLGCYKPGCGHSDVVEMLRKIVSEKAFRAAEGPVPQEALHQPALVCLSEPAAA